MYTPAAMPFLSTCISRCRQTKRLMILNPKNFGGEIPVDPAMSIKVTAQDVSFTTGLAAVYVECLSRSGRQSMDTPANPNGLCGGNLMAML